jgi:hypothetical protein
MAPLTGLTDLSNKKFHQCWTYHQYNVFNQIKLMIVSPVLLNYPDLNLSQYNIKPNASDFCLGAIIKQASIPKAFFSCNLTSAR